MDKEPQGVPPPYQQLPEVPPVPPIVGRIVAPRPYFGKQPLQVTCGNCGQVILTTVEPQNGACAYIAAVVVFLLCFPFFWVPLVIDSCKDYRHICPSCRAVLGVYKNV